MIRRKDEMEAVAKHEVQKGMGDVAFHTFMTKEEADKALEYFKENPTEPTEDRLRRRELAELEWDDNVFTQKMLKRMKTRQNGRNYKAKWNGDD